MRQLGERRALELLEHRPVGANHDALRERRARVAEVVVAGEARPARRQAPAVSFRARGGGAAAPAGEARGGLAALALVAGAGPSGAAGGRSAAALLAEAAPAAAAAAAASRATAAAPTPGALRGLVVDEVEGVVLSFFLMRKRQS